MPNQGQSGKYVYFMEIGNQKYMADNVMSCDFSSPTVKLLTFLYQYTYDVIPLPKPSSYPEPTRQFCCPNIMNYFHFHNINHMVQLFSQENIYFIIITKCLKQYYSQSCKPSRKKKKRLQPIRAERCLEYSVTSQRGLHIECGRNDTQKEGFRSSFRIRSQ